MTTKQFNLINIPDRPEHLIADNNDKLNCMQCGGAGRDIISHTVYIILY